MKSENPEPKIMEKGILSEENVVEQQQPQNQTPKPNKKFQIPLKEQLGRFIEKISGAFLRIKYSKKPRIITLGIILALIILVSISLILIAGRKPKEEPKTIVKITIPSPNSTPDLEVEQAKKEVLVFKGKLDALNSELENVNFPQIDLDVNF